MKLKINGEAKEVQADSLNILELLTAQQVKMPEMVSVELNGAILDRDAFTTTHVKDGDELEFLYFMGGGQ